MAVCLSWPVKMVNWEMSASLGAAMAGVESCACSCASRIKGCRDDMGCWNGGCWIFME
jgi:hypothetical protein